MCSFTKYPIFPPPPKKKRRLTSWWFQPIWKTSVKLDHFPKDRGEQKSIWNHHLVKLSLKNLHPFVTITHTAWADPSMWCWRASVKTLEMLQSSTRRFEQLSEQLKSPSKKPCTPQNHQTYLIAHMSKVEKNLWHPIIVHSFASSDSKFTFQPIFDLK